MKVVCAWCIRDRKTGFLREKAPFDDLRETHGLCEEHFRQIKSNDTAPAAVDSSPFRLITGLFSPVSAWLHGPVRHKGDK